MRKRFFLIVAVICLVALALPACGGEEATPTSPATTAPTTAAPTTKAPTSAAPTTKAPTSAAPTTAAPTTAAPTTAAPTTAAPTTAAPAEVKIVKFNYTMPKGSAVALGFEYFALAFTEQSGGRYKVETYPLSGLFPDSGSLDAVQGGVAELVMTSTGSKLTDFPAASVTGLPTLTFHKKGVSQEEYFASAKAWEELLKNPQIASEFAPYKLIQPIEIDPSMLVMKRKAVVVPEDMRGLKIGGMSGTMQDYAKHFGAAGVFQIPPQSYMNMDKGVVDAMLNTWAQIGPYRLYEIADYVNTTNFLAGALIIVANHDFWNSMPQADQQLFMKCWQEGYAMSVKGMYDDNIKGKADAMAKSNMKIITPSDAQRARWEDAATIAFDTWAGNASKAGVEDPYGIINLYKGLINKYSTQK